MYSIVGLYPLSVLFTLLTSVTLLCLHRRAWRRDRQSGHVYQPYRQRLDVCKKSRDMECILTNAEKNMRIRMTPISDTAPDAAVEAAMRHDMEKFYPKLKIQPESITNDNYKSVKSRFKHVSQKHLSKEPPIPDRPLCTDDVTFDDTCLVYMVYANDSCRGEVEKEENTVDDTGTNKSSRNQLSQV